MLKGLKHIAISFLLIFVIPIIYQPVHIVLHHSDDGSECSHQCRTTKKKTGFPGVQKDNHCFICEYEFTVTDLPEENGTTFSENCFAELKVAREQKSAVNEEFNLISPRAPPFLCL